MKSIAGFLIAAAAMVATAASAQGEAAPETRVRLEPVREDVIEITLALERIDANNLSSPVAADYRFAAGERVRFDVRTSHLGYLAIGSIQEDGDVVKTWPKEASGHFVNAERWTHLPTQGGLRIRGRGPTKVALLFSPAPLPATKTGEAGEETSGWRKLKRIWLRGELEVDETPVAPRPVKRFQSSIQGGEVAVIEVTLKHE